MEQLAQLQILIAAKIVKAIFFFVLGTIFGSFLNCLIFRLEKKESFVFGRSYCPYCKKNLALKDLIPILSFIFLKGRCRYCKSKISLQYPLVEALTGILAVLVFSDFSNFFLKILTFLFFCLLISIFVFDLKYLSIPDKILNFSIFLSIFYRLFHFEFKNFLFSILPSFLFLALILFSKEKLMGLGDFKIILAQGIFLGWPKILICLSFAIFSGALVSLILIFLKKKSLKSKIPFAPFLVLGAFFSFFSPFDFFSFFF